MSAAGKRVLCAEPSADICELITTMLGRQGYEVSAATTVRECLDLALSQGFDLYMLDDDYIDGTSIDLCRRLRALTPETPILFFSTAALERDRQRGLDAGAAAYLTKPDDIFDIVQTINSILLPRAHADAERLDAARESN
jgi:DNA-binding response OmpR family regulator